jgi:HAD superfamily hydrolase (TIGR01509 family)
MLKTIIFDLGNVIVPLDFPAGYAAWSAATGHAAEEIERRMQSVDLYRAYEAGEVSTPEFHAAMEELMGVRFDEPALMNLWSSIFAEPTLVDAELLIRLKQRYRLVLLSNTNDLHFRFIRRNYPIVELFDSYVLSYEVGVMKPETRIYQAAVEAARCEAGECFFTDDLAANIEAARAAGLDAEVFVDEETLRGHLGARGVIVGT